MDNDTSTTNINNNQLILRHKYLTFGYIRKYIEPKLNKVIIPISVIKLCTKYNPLYEWIDFSIFNKKSFKRTINAEKSTMTLESKCSSEWSGFYCSKGFCGGIHFWKLKCIKYGGHKSDSPGIVTKTNDKVQDKWMNDKSVGHSYYLFEDNFWEFHKGHQSGNYKSHKINGNIEFQTNDELIMTLNFNESIFKIIRIRKNENNLIWKIKIDPNMTYYPCLGLHSPIVSKYELMLH